MPRCCPYASVLASLDLVSRHACLPACLKSEVPISTTVQRLVSEVYISA